MKVFAVVVLSALSLMATDAEDSALYDLLQSNAPPQESLAENSPQLACSSKVYDGHKVSYWTYASPGVDPAVPAALMVFHDGQGFANPTS